METHRILRPNETGWRRDVDSHRSMDRLPGNHIECHRSIVIHDVFLREMTSHGTLNFTRGMFSVCRHYCTNHIFIHTPRQMYPSGCSIAIARGFGFGRMSSHGGNGFQAFHVHAAMMYMIIHTMISWFHLIITYPIGLLNNKHTNQVHQRKRFCVITYAIHVAHVMTQAPRTMYAILSTSISVF